MINKKAYLLFEVIITITILSVGLVFVVRAVNYSMHVAQSAINYRQAFGLLSEKAFDIELSSGFLGLELQSEEGVFESDSDYRWSYSVSTFETLPFGNIDLIDLDVSWDKGRRKGNLGIESFVKMKE